VLGCLAVTADRLVPVPVPESSLQAVVLPVTTMMVHPSTTVAVSVVSSAPVAAVIRWPGIVTEVVIAVGDQIRSGQVLARVDGHPVVAMVSDKALYRDLEQGDKGWDVQVLQTWLLGLGFFDADVSVEFGDRTRASVMQWQASLGEPSTGAFRLSAVVWVGAVPPLVGEISQAPGQSTSPGDTLFSSVSRPESIRVVEPPGGVAQSGALLLTIASTSVPYSAGSGLVADPTSVTQITQALGASPEGIGRIQPVDPVTVRVLPASAVVTDAEGRTCAFPDQYGPAVPVSALSGGLGGVTVDNDFPLSNVLANPTLVRSDISCG